MVTCGSQRSNRHFLFLISVNPSVATVNAAGVVTPTGAGNTTLNLAYGTLTTQIPVSVAALSGRS